MGEHECWSHHSARRVRMSATELMVFAAPSQQRLRRSSVAAALQPSTQMVAFVASLLEVLLAAPRGRTRRQLEEGRELRAPSAPSQYQLRRSIIRSVQGNTYLLGTKYKIMWVTTQTQLFLTPPPQNSLAGEWPKLFRENNYEKTRFV